MKKGKDKHLKVNGLGMVMFVVYDNQYAPWCFRGERKDK